MAESTRKNFADSEEGKSIRAQLMQMAESGTFNSTPTYSANSGLYSDNLIPFVDKHMNYLIKHPSLEPHQYLANLRLMTRHR